MNATTKMKCAALALLVCAVAASGCGHTADRRTAEYNPEIDPAQFVSAITNSFFPLSPGATFNYRSKTAEGTETDKVFVTRETRSISDVTCVVVADTVWRDGNLTEATQDWYAQDRAGNVWYFGEDSKDFEGGKVASTAGSWESGVKGARPGIIMKANPRVGDTYREEFLPGEAEDMAEVAGASESVTVPSGSYQNCLKIREWSPLEPGVSEYKYYAPGVGPVRIVEGANEISELVGVLVK